VEVPTIRGGAASQQSSPPVISSVKDEGKDNDEICKEMATRKHSG
jgi:hypothetical protein